MQQRIDGQVSTHRETVGGRSSRDLPMLLRTFIFAYVLEGKRKTGVLPLDDANLAKSTSANDTQ